MKSILTVIVLLWSVTGISQILSGTVFSAIDMSPIPGATVLTSDGLATATDVDGYFELSLDGSQPATLTITFIGFQRFDLALDYPLKPLTIKLQPARTELDLVVISGGQHEKKLEDEVMSVDIIRPYLVRETGSQNLSTALARTPSLTILDGQASIRGGSGYSYGTGSRVQLILDGMPLLSGDLSEIWWTFVPIENLAQLEVVKGASSAIYGSGALNGVINVSTAWPSEGKTTKVSVYQGIFSNPTQGNHRWWHATTSPVTNGVMFSHQETFDRTDVVIGGNFTNDKAYLKFGDEQHLRMNTKARYRFKGTRTAVATLALNSQYQQQGRFFFWDNDSTGAYVPYQGTESYDKYLIFNIDPSISWYSHAEDHHLLQGRIFHNQRRDGDFIQTSQSTNYFLEYRFSRDRETYTTQAGVVSNFQRSTSSLYPGQELSTLNPGVYLQHEHYIKNTTLHGGVRMEWNQSVNDYAEQSKPIFRFGLNQRIGETWHVRASYGESFRFASIAERYIEAELTPLMLIRPNIDLVSEIGKNYELAVKKTIRLPEGKMFLDWAFFVLDYQNLIEYQVGAQFNDQGGFEHFFFQPYNVGQARISGSELSLTGGFKWNKTEISIYGGYTFIYAGDLSSDTTQIATNVYLDNLWNYLTNPEFSQAESRILKYRNRDQFKLDFQADRGRITLGATCYYQSQIDRIDEAFEFIIPNLVDYRNAQSSSIVYFDARCGFKASESMEVRLIGNNITNTEYSTRPGILAAPRSVILRFDFSF